MTAPSEAVEIYCVKCKAKTASRDIEAVTMKNGRAATRSTCVDSGTKKFRIGSCPDPLAHPGIMALDLGLTTYQLLSALDGVAPDIQSRSRRHRPGARRARWRGCLPHRRGGTSSLHRRPHRARGPAGQPAAARGSPGLDRAVRGRLPHRRGPPPAPALPPHQPGAAAPSPTAPATAASCSASRPWPWRTRICTSVLPTARAAKP